MGHTLTLEIADDLYEKLLRKAKETGKTPQEVLAEWVSMAVKDPAEDRLLQLAGEFESTVTDVSERHDDYIGRGLLKDLRGSDND